MPSEETPKVLSHDDTTAIMHRLDAWFREHFGSELPRNYTCFDTETTGFSRDKDVIVEWGHCMVRDGKPTVRANIVINWLGSGLVDDNWLINRLAQVKRKMAVNGNNYRITPAVMRKEGKDPEKIIPFIHEFLTRLKASRELLVSHNGWNYDVTMLQFHFRDFMEEQFEFDENLMFDTGAVEKASQMLADGEERILPKPGEDMKKYFKRVAAWRAAGVYWKVEHCVNRYDLNVDPAELHNAGADSYTLHLLFEKFRELGARPSTVRARRSAPRPQPGGTGKRRRGQRNR